MLILRKPYTKLFHLDCWWKGKTVGTENNQCFAKSMTAVEGGVDYKEGLLQDRGLEGCMLRQVLGLIYCSPVPVLKLLIMCFINEVWWIHGACPWEEKIHTIFLPTTIPCCHIHVECSQCLINTELWSMSLVQAESKYKESLWQNLPVP